MAYQLMFAQLHKLMIVQELQVKALILMIEVIARLMVVLNDGDALTNFFGVKEC